MAEPHASSSTPAGNQELPRCPAPLPRPRLRLPLSPPLDPALFVQNAAGKKEKSGRTAARGRWSEREEMVEMRTTARGLRRARPREPPDSAVPCISFASLPAKTCLAAALVAFFVTIALSATTILRSLGIGAQHHGRLLYYSARRSPPGPLPPGGATISSGGAELCAERRGADGDRRGRTGSGGVDPDGSARGRRRPGLEVWKSLLRDIKLEDILDGGPFCKKGHEPLNLHRATSA
jgi:hypothetical protein